MKNLEPRDGILIVDDHAITRAALESEIEKHSSSYYVIGEASDVSSAIQKIDELQPKIVFLDHSLRDSDGLKVFEHIKKYTGMKVFVFTQSFDPHVIRAYWGDPVMALVSKSGELEELRTALQSLRLGKRFISPLFIDLIEKNYLNLLTSREVEVIRFVSVGLSNKEVAERLGCSEHTIKSHKANIMSKLGCSTTVEVGVWATKNGLI